jgi:hypothetical protein
MRTLPVLGGGGISGPPAACSAASDRLDVFAVGPGNMVWRWWFFDGTHWSGPAPLPASPPGIPAEGVCAVSSAPGRVEVFAAEAGTRTPVWWRGNGSMWSSQQRLPGGAALSPVPVAATCASPDNIDVFAVGAGNTPWWWHWNGSSWTAPSQLPAAGVPAERIAAVSPAPGRLDVFAAGAANHLWHWRKIGAVPWFLEDLGGNLPAEGVSAVSWGPNRIDVFAASRDPGSPLQHWWSDGGAFSTDQFNGSRAAAAGLVPVTVSVVSHAPNRLDVVAVTGDARLAHWQWDGAMWTGPAYRGDGIPSGDVSAVVRPPHHVDVFVAGAGNTIRQWPGGGLENVVAQSWLNWPNNHQTNPTPGRLSPDSLEELVTIVGEAEARGQALRPVGSGWSNSDVAVSPGYVIETAGLAGVLTDVLPSCLNAAATGLKLVHVEAGIKLYELNEYLDGRSLAIKTMGGSSGQSLAGLISTSAHGMDMPVGPVPDMVRAIHLVGPGGAQHWVEPSTGITDRAKLKQTLGLADANIHYDDDWFNSVLVSMGSMGVIYSCVVEVETQYDLKPTREALDWADMRTRLKTTSDPFAGQRAAEIILNPYATGSARPCWLTTRVKAPPTEALPEPSGHEGFFASVAVAGTIAQVAVNPFSVVAFVSTAMAQRMGQATPQGWAHTVMGPRDPGPVRALSVEVAFDAASTRYVDFVDAVLELLRSALYDDPAHLCYLGYISLRFQGRSRAYLSPQNGPVRKKGLNRTCTVECAAAWRNPNFPPFQWGQTAILIARIESEARKFGGTLHWGMNDALNAGDVARAYPRLDTWRRVRWELTNRGTLHTFDSDFTRRCGLSEPPANPGWTSLGGVLTSGPAAAARARNSLDVFGRGTDQTLYVNTWTGSAWSGWTQVSPAPIGSDPAAVSSGPNGINVVARGTDNQMYAITWSPAGWGTWQGLGGVFTSGPAIASQGLGQLDVFGRGTDQTLYVNSSTGGGWSGWNQVSPAPIGSDPAAISWGPGRIDVFAKGTDDQMYTIVFDGPAGWGAWQPLGGLFTSGPAVASWGPNRLDVFGRGTDQSLYSNSWSGSAWSGWNQVAPAPIGSDPAAVSWGPNRIDVFAKGTDDQMYTLSRA